MTTANCGKASTRFFGLIVVLLAAAGVAAAQTANPTKVEFTASSDHNALLPGGGPVVEKYVFNIYQAGAAEPFHSIDLGKPTPDATNKIVSDFSSTLPGWPLPGGVYESRVAAVGPTGQGLSAVSNTFTFDSSPPPACTSFSISPTSVSPTYAAGSQAVTIAGSPSGCTGGSWSASESLSWLSLSATSGTGPGTVTVSWTANTATSPRSGSATIAGTAFPVTQAAAPPPTCTSFSISPAWANVGDAAGSQTVTVTGAPSGCTGGAWTTAGNGSWLTVTPSSGSGPGTATVAWTANTSMTPRSSTATVAGNAFTVTQAGAAAPACSSFTINPASASPGSASGSMTVAVVGAPAGCSGGAWTAAGNGSWLTVSPQAGTGSGTVTVAWTANTAPSARSAAATIAGNAFNVTQSGTAAAPCTAFSIAPGSADPSPAAGSSSVQITGSPSGCSGGAWSAATHVDWLTVSPATGSGPGSVTLAWTANRTSMSRSDSATIAGNQFPVRQASATGECTVSITPTSISFPTPGGKGYVGVQVESGCTWDVVASDAWIRPKVTSGTGASTLEYSVTNNRDPGPRSGTLVIGGVVHTVTQDSQCSYTLSATSRAFTAEGGADSVQVTTGGGCTWTTATRTRWIQVSASVGTGSGTASYVVYPNTTKRPRKGSVTIGEATVTITQDASPGSTAAPSTVVSRYNTSQAAYVVGYDEVPSPDKVSLNAPLSEASAARVAWGTQWSAVVSGDFNADGEPDHVLYDEATGAWTRASRDRGGDFAYESGAWPAGLKLLADDFDGDGSSDVFGYNPVDGSWQRCLGGTPASPAFACSTGAWPAGRQVFPAGFDEAGARGLLLFDAATGAWAHAANGAGGLDLTGVSGTWPAGAWNLQPGDFDGDGRSGDFLLYDPATGQAILQLDTGSGFTAGGSGTWSPGWKVFGGDFNADGRTDVLLYNASEGRRSLGLAAGSGQFSWSSGEAPPGCEVVVRDVNGDDLADAVFYDAAGGNTTIAISRLSTRGHELRVTTGGWGIGWKLIASVPGPPLASR